MTSKEQKEKLLMKLTAETLIEACGDESYDSGLSIQTALEPMAGPGAPVKPAVYAGGHYQLDKRWIGSGESAEAVDAVVIDNVPSQANRLEAALRGLVPVIGLPEIILDLSSVTYLPPHIPNALSSFQLPHRNADAYLRDADLDGQPFIKSEIGKAIFEATPQNPAALLQWMPQALLFGFWQSHLGKKGPQTKLARSWTSEIVGYSPASVDTRRLGLKGDPLNLSIDDAITYNDDNPLEWDVVGGTAKKGSKSKDSLAEVGHGQVPVSSSDAPLGAISFASTDQKALASFAGLRNIAPGQPGGAELRALLVALGVVAHSGAFGRGFTLRSGADLLPAETSWTWLGEVGREPVEALTMSEARELFAGCVQRAEAVGLPVGSSWAKEPLVLTPNAALGKVLAQTFPESVL